MGSYIAGNRPEREKRSMIKAKANVYKGLKHFWTKTFGPQSLCEVYNWYFSNEVLPSCKI